MVLKRHGHLVRRDLLVCEICCPVVCLQKSVSDHRTVVVNDLLHNNVVFVTATTGFSVQLDQTIKPPGLTLRIFVMMTGSMSHALRSTGTYLIQPANETVSSSDVVLNSPSP